jgi:hypothetical protein
VYAIAVFVFIGASLIVSLVFKLLGYNISLSPAIILFTIGLFTYISAFSKYKRLRCIRDTQTSKIGSAPMGFVEICGKAKRISGAGFIYRFVRIRERVSKWDALSKNNEGPGINREEYSLNPFYIDDGTGTAYIDPSKAEIIVDTKTWSDKDYICEESEIKEGDEIYCLGTAGVVNGGDLSEKIYEALRAAKTDKKFYARYDANGDGKISPDEWEYARKDIAAKTIEENRTNAKHGFLEINKGAHDKIFIISNKSEKVLISGFIKKTLAMLFGGVFLTVVAIFNALVNLNVLQGEFLDEYSFAIKTLNQTLLFAAYAALIGFIVISHIRARYSSL